MRARLQRLNQVRPQFSRLLCVTLCMLMAGASGAATYTWDGGDGSSQNWSMTDNWDANGVPVSASDAVAIIDGNNNVGTGGARLQQDVDAPLTLNHFTSRNPTSGSDPIGNAYIGGNALKFVIDGATRPLLEVRRKGNTDIANSIVIDGAGTTLEVISQTWSVLLNGQLSGAGSLYFNTSAGGGGLNLSNGSNSYAGGTTYHNNAAANAQWNYFRIYASGALGNGTFSIRGGNRVPWDSGSNNQPGGTVFFGAGQVHGNNINLLTDASISAGDPRGAASSGDSVDLTGTVELDQYTLYLRGVGAGTVSGNIVSSGVTGSRGLTKLGAPGSWTLSGANTYAGQTAVGLGTLLVTGSHAGGSGYTVSNSATLGGSGTIDLSAQNGSVTIEAGGGLAPGDATDATGTLTLSLGAGTCDVSAVDFSGGLQFDLGTVADSDKVVVTGALDIGTLVFADFSFTAQGGFGPGTYTLFEAGSLSGSIGTAANGTIGGRAAILIQNGNNVELLVSGAHAIRVWRNIGANWNTAANWGGDAPDTGGNGGELALLPSAASVVNPSLAGDFTISDLEIYNDQADYIIVNSGAGARTLTLEPGAGNPGQGIVLSGGNTSIGTAAGATTGVKFVPKGAQTWDITGTLTFYGTGSAGGGVGDNSGEITKTGSGTVVLDNGGAYGGGVNRLVVEQGTITGSSPSSSQLNIFATSGDALTMYGGTELADFRLAIPAYADQSIRFNGSGSGGARITTGGCTMGGPADGASTRIFNIDDGDADLDMEITAQFTEWAGPGNQTTIGLRKTGTGTLAITDGLHDGPTSVEEGTLLVNGTHTVDDSAGSYGGPFADYTVGGNATLGGSGTINLFALNGNVTVQAGGNLSPGDTSDPTGTFTLTLGTGILDVSAIAGTGGLAFDLGSVGDSDKVLVNSALDIGTLNFGDFTFTPRSGFGPGTYPLFEATTVVGTIGTENVGDINDHESTLILNDTGPSVIIELVAREVSDGTVFVIR